MSSSAVNKSTVSPWWLERHTGDTVIHNGDSLGGWYNAHGEHGEQWLHEWCWKTTETVDKTFKISMYHSYLKAQGIEDPLIVVDGTATTDRLGDASAEAEWRDKVMTDEVRKSMSDYIKPLMTEEENSATGMKNERYIKAKEHISEQMFPGALHALWTYYNASDEEEARKSAVMVSPSHRRANNMTHHHYGGDEFLLGSEFNNADDCVVEF